MNDKHDLLDFNVKFILISFIVIILWMKKRAYLKTLWCTKNI